MLDQRQKQELADLEARCETEKEEVLKDTIDQLEAKHEEERQRLMARHEEAMANLLAKAGGLTADELEEEKSRLIEQQQTELSRLEADYTARNLQLQQGTRQQLQLKHAQARLELRTRHYQVRMLRFSASLYA